MTSRLRFVDEYLFNNQYSSLINSISIIVYITNPLNTNLIYVIVITAKDQIKFLSFKQIWERRYNAYNFFKEICRGESSLGQTIEMWSSSSMSKEHSGQILFSTGKTKKYHTVRTVKIKIKKYHRKSQNWFSELWPLIMFSIIWQWGTGWISFESLMKVRLYV